MKKNILFTALFFILILSMYANADEHLRTVRQLFSERKFDEAFLLANQIITDHPNTLQSFDARIIVAEIHLQRGLLTEARMQIMLLLTNPFQMSFSQRARTYYTLGLIFYRERNYERAIESFDRLFLDYRDTTETHRAISLYFDCLLNINDYQSMIIKSREFLRHYRTEEIQAELFYQQARGYIAGNMIDHAQNTIQEINSRFSQTSAASKAIELQIILHERESGKQFATSRLEAALAGTLTREMEERLTWLLVQYYIDLGQISRATERLDFLLNRFNLSEHLSEYYVVWLGLMIDARNIRSILQNEEFIIRVSLNRPAYSRIIYYLAKTHFLAQNFWVSRAYLDDNINTVVSDTLRFDYRFLYADIFTAQGQFMNSIDIYYLLLNQYGGLGRNYEVLIKLGNIYHFNLNQPAQALNFYRQAVGIAKTADEISSALLLSSQSLEAIGQYTEALSTLTEIPLEKITDARQRDSIANKITLLQIFYASDTKTALTNYFIQQMRSGGELTLIDYTSILSLDLKQYNEALALLQTQNTYQTRMERIKFYFLFAYKNAIVGNHQEKDRYIALIQNERNQLGRNIINRDLQMINSFNDFITGNGRLNARSVNNTVAFIRSEPANSVGLCFVNFFTFQLWQYYLSNNMTDEMRQIAPTIVSDAFVNNLDFQRVNIVLANEYFSDRNYISAIDHFNKAPRYLTLAYPEYFYKYAMSLYETRNTQRALEILQNLVLNYPDYDYLIDARNMIITYWISINRLIDALDILNQIPPLRRTDNDFRYFQTIYSTINDLHREKEALLFIRNKSWEEMQRMALLHHLTGDTVLAEYTWNDILSRTDQNIFRLNARAGLGKINFEAEKYADAISQYEQFFTLYNASVRAESLTTEMFIIAPSEVAKELIISSYLTNNRPKADTHIRNLSNLYSRNNEIQAEIKLHEGMYYVRIEPRRATRILSQVIEDNKTPIEIVHRAMYHRGLSSVPERRFDLAERDFLAALNTSNEKLKNQVRLALGNFYLTQERPIESLEYYYQVIVNDHDGKLARDAAHNFAIIARQLQDWEKAIAAYKIIMDRWGQTHLAEETRLTIGFCFFQAKQYDQALNIFNQLLEELTSNELRAETLYWMGESLLAKGEFTEAETAFQSVRQRFPRETKWVSISAFRIAESYHDRGYTDRANEMFREIIRVFGPGSDVGREAAKYLAQ
jgi:TolA-binding protein